MAFLTRLVNNLPFLSSRSEFLHNKSQRSADVELDNKTTKDDLLFMNRPDELEPHGGGRRFVCPGFTPTFQKGVLLHSLFTNK